MVQAWFCDVDTEMLTTRCPFRWQNGSADYNGDIGSLPVLALI